MYYLNLYLQIGLLDRDNYSLVLQSIIWNEACFRVPQKLLEAEI